MTTNVPDLSGNTAGTTYGDPKTKTEDNVSADITSSALPAGAATAAHQLTTLTKLDTLHTDLADLVASLPCGISASATFTPTAVAYGAGDIMDTAKEFVFTFADGTPIPAGSLIQIQTAVLKIDETALQASEGAYTLHNYDVTPPSAQADNALWALASSDLSSYRGNFSIGTPADLGSALHVKTSLINEDIKLMGTSMFARLVTAAGFTPTAVARQVFLYGMVK